MVYLPLWKIWVRQLGLWHSQYMESHKSHVPNHQPYIYIIYINTNVVIIYNIYIYIYIHPLLSPLWIPKGKSSWTGPSRRPASTHCRPRHGLGPPIWVWTVWTYKQQQKMVWTWKLIEINWNWHHQAINRGNYTFLLCPNVEGVQLVDWYLLILCQRKVIASCNVVSSGWNHYFLQDLSSLKVEFLPHQFTQLQLSLLLKMWVSTAVLDIAPSLFFFEPSKFDG